MTALTAVRPGSNSWGDLFGRGPCARKLAKRLYG